MRSFCPIRLSLLLLAALFVVPTIDANAQAWTTKLDKSVRFYQTTDLGVLLVGTEKSLYAIDGSTGETGATSVSSRETSLRSYNGL
jgi:hypothetical protein